MRELTSHENLYQNHLILNICLVSLAYLATNVPYKYKKTKGFDFKIKRKKRSKCQRTLEYIKLLGS